MALTKLKAQSRLRPEWQQRKLTQAGLRGRSLRNKQSMWSRRSKSLAAHCWRNSQMG